MLKAICAKGLDVIGMVNQLKQFYCEWLTILSTDLSLPDAEIVRLYGNR